MSRNFVQPNNRLSDERNARANRQMGRLRGPRRVAHPLDAYQIMNSNQAKDSAPGLCCVRKAANNSLVCRRRGGPLAARLIWQRSIDASLSGKSISTAAHHNANEPHVNRAANTAKVTVPTTT